MNKGVIEIIREKKVPLTVALLLLLINIALAVVAASFQEPALAAQRIKWSELRDIAARSGHADAAALYRQGKSDLEKLHAMIPPKREFTRVLSDLFDAASDSGVQPGAITYKPLPVKEESLLSYQLSFAVSGNYAAVKSFLADLGQNPELIVIDGVSLTNSDLFVENVVMNLNITVYLREGA